MVPFTVRHRTEYRYAAPVSFGEHRLMLRPRDSHDLRLDKAELILSPAASSVRWFHDVFGNSVAVATFDTAADRLSIESVLHLVRYPRAQESLSLTDAARTYPFIYSADDRSDLGRLLERHYPDARGAVDEWARGFVSARPMPTMDLLSTLNDRIRATFRYEARDTEGTQPPEVTLERGAGSCRDFALLMIEALRSLGFGARFVSGYLYDPALDGGAAGTVGAGQTHAWVDVYLPGAGWVEFDPTNAAVDAGSLIRVAVTRDPSQAVPVAGSFTGRPSDPLGMTVEVLVQRTDEPSYT
ncbi:transglutaminase family protein [Alsobacter sp. R-9]